MPELLNCSRSNFAKFDPDVVYVVTTVFGLVVRRDPLTTQVPDLALFLATEMVEEDGYIHSAPELIVEVLSQANTRSECSEKLRDYESLGVPEVWVVSPEAETIEVLQLQDGQLKTASILRAGRIAPLHFPNAAIDVAAIWPRQK